jgi:hypothetical protein
MLLRDGIRWGVVFLLTLVLIGIIAFARGEKHHRGDDVGALRAVTASEVWT